MSLMLAYPMFSYWGSKLWKNANEEEASKEEK